MLYLGVRCCVPLAAKNVAQTRKRSMKNELSRKRCERRMEYSVVLAATYRAEALRAEVGQAKTLTDCKLRLKYARQLIFVSSLHLSTYLCTSQLLASHSEVRLPTVPNLALPLGQRLSVLPSSSSCFITIATLRERRKCRERPTIRIWVTAAILLSAAARLGHASCKHAFITLDTMNRDARPSWRA